MTIPPTPPPHTCPYCHRPYSSPGLSVGPFTAGAVTEGTYRYIPVIDGVLQATVPVATAGHNAGLALQYTLQDHAARYDDTLDQ